MMLLLYIPLISSIDAPLSCGAVSLYLLAREEGGRMSLAESAEALPLSPGGSSFEDLQRCGERFGLDLRLKNARRDGGSLPLVPFVAHYESVRPNEPGHFVFFRPMDDFGELYQMIAPPNDPTVLSRKQILGSPAFSGWTLSKPKNANHWVPVGLIIAGGILAAAGARSSFAGRKRKEVPA